MNELWDIRIGDVREQLALIPDASIQCVVTSPPYWGQRDYGVDGMIGLEADVQDWFDVMVEVFRDIHRVLRSDGTLWLNLGDKYNNSPKGNLNGQDKSGLTSTKTQEHTPPKVGGRVSGLKPKNLIGLPWRVAFALQADGWILRRDIIWSKPNPMPESVTDRPTSAHEYLFLLTKSAKYYYDADAITEPASPNTHLRISQNVAAQIGSFRANGGTKSNGPMKAVIRSPKTVANPDASGGIKQNSSFADATALPVTRRNKRSVWEVPTTPFSEAHFATFPEKLVEPCVKAGSATGDLVLDPFSGAGTTGLVAVKHDRRYIGIELNPEYAELSRRRIAAAVGVRSPETATAIGNPVQGSMAFNTST